MERSILGSPLRDFGGGGYLGYSVARAFNRFQSRGSRIPSPFLAPPTPPSTATQPRGSTSSIGDELDCDYVSAGPAGLACTSEAALLTNEHVGPVVALNGRGQSVVAAGDQDTAGDEETFGLLADEV